MVYTVGNERNYDECIIFYGDKFVKSGRVEGVYAGGFVVRTPEDGWRLVVEHDKIGEWAVYEVAAIWERNMVQSENGWWHALLDDSVVVRKVIGSRGNRLV